MKSFAIFFLNLISIMQTKIMTQDRSHSRSRLPSTLALGATLFLILGVIFYDLEMFSIFLLLISLICFCTYQWLQINSDPLYSFTHALSEDGNPGFIMYSIKVIVFFSALSLFVGLLFGGSGNTEAFYLTAFFTPLVAILVCGFLSLMAQIDVALLVNGILSAILFILIEAINLLISTLEVTIPFTQKSNMDILINQIGIPGINLGISAMLFPLFLMFFVSSIIVIIKKYWLEKYNGTDIHE